MKIAFSIAATLAWLVLPAPAQTLSSYQSTVLGQSPTYYFQLDGTLTNKMGGGVILETNGLTGAFMQDAFRNSTNSYSYFNGSDALTNASDLVTGGGLATNDAANAKGSITLLFRALDGVTTGQKFILFQGNVTADGNGLGLFFENNTSTSGDYSALKLRVGNGTTAILSSNSIAFGGWYYFAMTYDESRDAGEVNWYLGRFGSGLNSGTIDMANDAVVGDDGAVYVGNQTNFTSAFRSPGKGRIDEVAFWNRELSAGEVAAQFASLPDSFPANATYQQVVAAQLPAHQYKLDNSLADAVSGGPALSVNGSSGAFVADVLGLAASAYSFNETNDALYLSDVLNGGGPGLSTTASGNGTITFLFRSLSETNNTGQRFLFAQGGTSGTRNQLSLFLENTNAANGSPNALKLRVGNGPTTAILQPESIETNAWYFFAMAYDESRNSNPGEVKWYLGRVGSTLTNGAIDIGNDSVVGDNGTFAIGNRESMTNNAFRNPGSGAIDEFAIWTDELAADEILAQFSAVTNVIASGPAPTLTVTAAGANVLISWPANSSPSYVLEATNALTAAALATPNWPGAGTATVVGTNYVVTNALSSGNSFYRLHKY